MNLACDSGVYRLIFPSGKLYIGKSIELKARMEKYRYLACKPQIKLYRAIKKYGWGNVKIEILLYSTNNDILNEMEKFYIKYYNSIESGYNLTGGGEGFRKRHSEESKRKMSLAQKGRIISKETREKISKNSAHIKWWLGKSPTQETRNKIRDAMLGRKHTEEYKKRMSLTNKNKVYDSKELFDKILPLYSGGLTSKQCAKILNMSESTILKVLKYNNIERRSSKKMKREKSVKD